MGMFAIFIYIPLHTHTPSVGTSARHAEPRALRDRFQRCDYSINLACVSHPFHAQVCCETIPHTRTGAFVRVIVDFVVFHFGPPVTALSWHNDGAGTWRWSSCAGDVVAFWSIHEFLLAKGGDGVGDGAAGAAG